MQRAEAVLSGIPRVDLVRLEISGRRRLGFWVDTISLERSYKDRFYYFEILDRSRLEIRAEDYVNDRSLKGEFIRLVNSDDSLCEEEKEKIILCGLNALLGEGEL